MLLKKATGPQWALWRLKVLLLARKLYESVRTVKLQIEAQHMASKSSPVISFSGSGGHTYKHLRGCSAGYAANKYSLTQEDTHF